MNDKSDMNVITELKGVGKSFRSGPEELIILDKIDLTVRRGESVSVTGESGCGKSTLLNLIGGLDAPTAGSIDSCGYRVDKLSEKNLTAYRSFKVGFVFQFHYLLKDFTALENVMLPGIMAGKPWKEVRERARRLIEEVNLSGRTTHYPSQLSGGERQRIALARSLMNDPELILADEPTGNLDEKHSRIVEEILFDLTGRFGKTLMLVTHDTRLAGRGSRRYLLKERTLHEL